MLLLLGLLPALATEPAVHPGATVAAKAECTACHVVPTLAAPTRTGSCVTCHEWIRSTAANPSAREKAMAIFPKWARYEKNVRTYFHVPNLNASFARLDPAWMRVWLADPHDLRPGMDETMVRLGLDEAALRELTEWAGGFAVKVASTPPPAARNVESGATLYATRACATCHSFGARKALPGIPDAPDLRWARDRMSDDMIVAWIQNPQAVSPTATMPALGLSLDEAVALRDFLVLSDPGGVAPAPAAASASTVASPTWDDVEAQVFGKICAHCHMDPSQNEGRGGPGNQGGYGWAATGIELQTYEGVVANGPAIMASIRRRQGEEARDHVRAGEVPATVTRPALPGMPLGLPALPEADIQMVEAWFAAGAPR